MGVALLAGNGTDERQRFTSDQIQVVVQRRHMVRMVKPTEIDPAAPQPTHDSRAVARIDDVVLTRLDHEGRALDARQQIVRHGHKAIDLPEREHRHFGIRQLGHAGRLDVGANARYGSRQPGGQSESSHVGGVELHHAVDGTVPLMTSGCMAAMYSDKVPPMESPTM